MTRDLCRTRIAQLALGAILVAGGCSSTPPEQFDERRYREAEFRADFIAFREECLSQDRRVVIDSTKGAPRHGFPHYGDRVYCF